MQITIKGTFVIARAGLGPYLPDGDTIRFQPDDPSQLARLARHGQAADTIASVRFEAIDALEKDQAQGQDPNYAVRARDEVFRLLGLAQVARDINQFTVRSAQEGEARGYLLAHSLDKYGRVIAFVFPGDSARPDGAVVTATPAEIQRSVNYELVRTGMVYPTFYATVAPEHRAVFAQAGQEARQANLGLWAQAVGTPDRAARVRSLDELRSLTLFPTLHRRLDDYLTQHSDFSQLKAWIRADPQNRNKAVLLLASGQSTDFAGLLVAEGQTVRLRVQPEDFVFVDQPPVDVPEELPPPNAELRPGDVLILAALIDPSGTDRGSERVTLLNTTNQAIDLSGFSLSDNRAHESLTGVLGAGAVRQHITSLELGNQGDSLVLASPAGEMDKVSYNRADVKPGRTLVFKR